MTVTTETAGGTDRGSGSGENWKKGTGTQYLTGQKVYRGDLALIEMAVGKSSDGKIYRGGPTAKATESAADAGMFDRAVAVDDPFCTGGKKTGEICGWTVATVGTDHKYGNGEMIRSAVISKYKDNGKCVRMGDSGGLVYQVRPDGTVTALGIHSGPAGLVAATTSPASWTRVEPT
ncbi:MAG: hypothetical protein GXX79_11115 [Actinomycetales bacterium]|nr:hypothetical protein [Actinomycetales bacterium]